MEVETGSFDSEPLGIQHFLWMESKGVSYSRLDY